MEYWSVGVLVRERRWRVSVGALVLLACGSLVLGKPEPMPGAGADITVAQPPVGAANLILNGDFEIPNDTATGPAHWQDVDNLVFHWTNDAAAPARGKVMCIDTDVNQRQAYAWWVERFVRGVPPAQAPAKEPTHPPKYDTIGGLDGGFYASDYIPVKPGGAYRVYVDAKGPKAKVFIFGYDRKLPRSFGDEQPATQQVFRKARGEPQLDARGRPIKYRLRYFYRTWFAVGDSDEWRTCTHRMPRHPNNSELTEDVRFIRIQIYPYWPCAQYWFDNVRVIEVDPGGPASEPLQRDEYDY